VRMTAPHPRRSGPVAPRARRRRGAGRAAEWLALTGRYRSWDPWAPGFEVLVRGEGLRLELLGASVDLEGPAAPRAAGRILRGRRTAVAEPDPVRHVDRWPSDQGRVRRRSVLSDGGSLSPPGRRHREAPRTKPSRYSSPRCVIRTVGSALGGGGSSPTIRPGAAQPSRSGRRSRTSC
jgi:hypothetical protein